MTDDELQSLKRRADADPGDAARRCEYERELLRSGRGEEVRRAYLARFSCDFRWGELERDRRSARVRYCTRCKRGVTLVSNGGELDDYAVAGQQVAGGAGLLDALVEGALERLRQGAPPDPRPDCFAVATPSDIADVERELGVQRARRNACDCLADEVTPRPTRFHMELQDTKCEAWLRLLELIDKVAQDCRATFEPRAELGEENWRRIITLPPTIAKLRAVRRFMLYGSWLVRIPAEIGEMTSLEEFDPYTSYSLHWFPYEITRCKNLVRSRISTRALYGNYKHRPLFPDLEIEQGPAGSACSVCERPASSLRQSWISLRVATDVMPLLVNTCSRACMDRLPPPAAGYVPRPHRGGRTNRTPGA